VSELLKVFVYGTLKPGECNYQPYCAGRVIEVHPAIAFGQLYDLPLGYPAMTLGNSAVQGYLLTLTDSAALDILDELEDYHPQRSPDQNEYIRQRVDTFNLNHQPLGPAWAYLMELEQVKRLDGILLPQAIWASDLPRTL
jgi:gamma-glutamylcyclotransferase (GGCT)/AIG2-like uncharacterized protein YtfP